MSGCVAAVRKFGSYRGQTGLVPNIKNLSILTQSGCSPPSIAALRKTRSPWMLAASDSLPVSLEDLRHESRLVSVANVMASAGRGGDGMGLAARPQ
jgi:hypothetical protein